MTEEAPVLTGPNGIVTNPVLYSWAPVSGAARYRLQVDRIDIPQTRVVYRDNLATTTWLATSALVPGRYRVWVQAVTANAAFSAWSSPLDFQIQTSG